MDNEQKKIVIIALSVLYEWCSLRYGDKTKQGYTMNKIKDENLLDSVDDIIKDIRTIFLSNKVKDEHKQMISKIISIYDEHGISENFKKEFWQVILEDPSVKKELGDNLFLAKFFNSVDPILPISKFVKNLGFDFSKIDQYDNNGDSQLAIEKILSNNLFAGSPKKEKEPVWVKTSERKLTDVAIEMINKLNILKNKVHNILEILSPEELKIVQELSKL